MQKRAFELLKDSVAFLFAADLFGFELQKSNDF
jgi:hypothetical protein